MENAVDATDTMTAIMEIDGDLLSTPVQIDGDSDFHELRGNSLLTGILVAKLHSMFSAKVAVREAFRRASPRQLSEIIATAAGHGVAAATVTTAQHRPNPAVKSKEQPWRDRTTGTSGYISQDAGLGDRFLLHSLRTAATRLRPDCFGDEPRDHDGLLVPAIPAVRAGRGRVDGPGRPAPRRRRTPHGAWWVRSSGAVGAGRARRDGAGGLGRDVVTAGASGLTISSLPRSLRRS